MASVSYQTQLLHARILTRQVLVQSQSVLTRPYCLLEILTAMDAGVPIVGVALCKHAFPYCFEGASALLEALDAWSDVWLQAREAQPAPVAPRAAGGAPRACRREARWSRATGGR